MRADSAMTRDVIAVPAEMSVENAWATMSTWKIRHLPVVRAGVLIGMVSDRDLLLRATKTLNGTLTFDDVTLSDVMTVAPVTCGVTTVVSFMAREMIERKIDALPIVDHGNRIVGLVTSTDLLSLLIHPDEDRKLPFDFDLKLVNVDGAMAA